MFTGGAATDTVRLDNTSSNSLVTVSTANAFDLRRDFTFVGTNSLNLGTGVATFGPSTTTGTRIISVTANTLTFGGSIKETGVYAMTKSGNGTLVFSGTGSTYSGLSSVSAGTLAGIGANAFGNTSNISIAAAGTLSLRGDSDTIFAKTIDNVTRYTVSTTASAATINVDQATAGNTAAKTMTIGTLTVGSAAATAQTKLTGTNGASLSVGAVTNTTAASGTTQFTNTISGGGSFTLASYTDTRTGTPTLKFDGSGNTTVTGAIAQNGVNTLALTYSGTGILTLNGASSFTGATTASSGTLLVNGGVAGTSSGTGTGSVSVTGTGSVLGGTGAISGNVSIGAGSKITGGTLGTSAANAAANVGTLNTGALTLNATSVFLVDIGTTTSFDKLSITGINNTLAGTLTLNIATGLTFTAGQQLSLIDNDGTDAFIGTFAGVAEGGAVTSGGYSFTASYRGTDGLTGNDFVLTATAVPEPSTWVGAGLISGLALNSLRRRRQSSI